MELAVDNISTLARCEEKPPGSYRAIITD